MFAYPLRASASDHWIALQALLSYLLEQLVCLNSSKASLLEGRKVIKNFLLILDFLCVYILSGCPASFLKTYLIASLDFLYLYSLPFPHTKNKINLKKRKGKKKDLKSFWQGQPEVCKWQLAVVAVGSVLSCTSGVWLWSLVVFFSFHLFWLWCHLKFL